MRPDRGFVVSTFNAGDTTLISCAGELDMMSSDRLGEAIDLALTAHPSRLHLDLRGLRFFGSEGVRLLVSMTALCGERDIPLGIAINPMIARVLELSGLRSTLPVSIRRSRAS